MWTTAPSSIPGDFPITVESASEPILRTRLCPGPLYDWRPSNLNWSWHSLLHCRIKVEPASQRRVLPRHLLVVCLLAHIVADGDQKIAETV
jgi:hypothetical protein